VEGGPEDEASADRPEEEEVFWVEPALTHNEKDFSPITYQKQHVHVKIHMQITERMRRALLVFDNASVILVLGNSMLPQMSVN